MRDQQLRDAWHARECAVSISPSPTFKPEGLVLGASTVLIAADGRRQPQSLEGQETRLLALLSATYGRAVAPAVLGNIERAAKAWRDGEECLAYIHLAHSGLQAPSDVRAAAYRLFVAENAMQAGLSSRAVFQALQIDRSYIDAVEKAYNPAEPRVPAGSGKTSGQWTDSEQTGTDAAATEETGADAAATEGPAADGPRRSLSLLDTTPPPAASFLGELSAAQVLELGLYAARIATLVGGATAAFGLLFIPSPNDVRVEGEVQGLPGLRYSWNRDETELHLTYDDPAGGQRTFSAFLEGDEFHDLQGNVIGRVFGGNRVAIDVLAVLPDVVKRDEPRLCPAYAPDVAGSDQGKPYEQNKPRQYEDFLKQFINPPPYGPTPSGFVYYLPNPDGSKPVSYDDCEKTTSILFEFKGEGYTKLTNDLPGAMAYRFIRQATRQVAASGQRPIVWIFAEEGAAFFARKLFDSKGLKMITVGYIPWTRSGR